MPLRLKPGAKVPQSTNLVCNAIDAMDGPSLGQITKYYANDKGIPAASAVRTVKLAVKRGLDNGIIKKKNGVYELHNVIEIDAEEMMVSHRRKAKAAKKPAKRRGKSPAKRRKSQGKRRHSVKRRKSVKRTVKRRVAKRSGGGRRRRSSASSDDEDSGSGSASPAHDAGSDTNEE